MLRRALVPLVLLGVLLAPVVAAQETAPVEVTRVDEGTPDADEGRPATANFTLFNLNPDDDFFVTVSVAGPPRWDESAAPNRFALAPRTETNVTVTFTPQGQPHADAAFTVTFNLVHSRTGVVTKVTQEVEVRSAAPPRVLDVFSNPLPAPLDNGYGTFLLDMAFWAVIGLGAIFAGDAIVRAVTARASNQVTREIITLLRKPIFYFVLLLGMGRSFAHLPRNVVTDFVARTLLAVAIGIFGLYVLYRVLDAVLLYYQKEVAPRTETNVDDVLVPVLRKVGIVVLYVVGIVLTLKELGWDPTIVFAGAGIAGLVIAFAAQDTMSNLFSGVFILLDQPFREGDLIQLDTGEIVRVESIGLRTTRLYHGKNHESIVLPNNQLATKRIINLAGPDQRYWLNVEVGAAYGSSTEHVRRVLLQAAHAHPRVLRGGEWEPLVLFTRFGESSLDFLLRAAVDDYRDRNLVASELRHAIKKAFDEAGIEIPFPQRTLHIKGPAEPLQPPPR